MFRQGFGGNRANYLDFYVGDTISRDRWTLDLGLRYDRQDGEALPSDDAGQIRVPGPGARRRLRRLQDAVHVEQLVAARRPDLRARRVAARRSCARATPATPGQLNTGTVGVLNPSSTAGSCDYRWVDLNGDHFAQADEVQLNNRISAGGGFNPDNPTAVTSANVLDPNLKAPVTSSFVVGIDRELMPNLAVAVNYSYTRTTRSVRQLHRHDHAARRRDARGLRAGQRLLRHAFRSKAASPTTCRRSSRTRRRSTPAATGS